MKSIVLMLLIAAATTHAHAQSNADALKRDINRLLTEIESELRVSRAGDGSLRAARQQLSSALDLIKSGAAERPRGRRANLTCVSRDNDGREPYQLAVRDPRDFSTVKIPNAVLTLGQCEEAADSGQTAGTMTFFCASRDGDARDPYSIYGFDAATRQSIKLDTVGSFGNCTSTTMQALSSRTHFAYCASRDNDGRSPYIRISFDVIAKTSQKFSDTFNTLEACNRAR